MIEVHRDIFVGEDSDFTAVCGQDGWAILHACKEPYHRGALGYAGRGAPRDHPEYLVARRGDELCLNIVDADNPAFFAEEMIGSALDFISESLAAGRRVLVHCNQGESRSPSIALLYLATRINALPNESLVTAETMFRTLYPRYNPGAGIRGHLQNRWDSYVARGRQ